MSVATATILALSLMLCAAAAAVAAQVSVTVEVSREAAQEDNGYVWAGTGVGDNARAFGDAM